jgi:hypothetical protein
MATKHMKKMLTILGYKGNENQNHTKTDEVETLYLLELLPSRTPPTTNVG